jgi:hypothetical protein
MEVHECGGEKSYSFFGISLNSLCKCDHESKDHSDGCCKNKKTVVKAEHNDKQTIKVFIAKQLIQDFDNSIPIEFYSRHAVLNGHNSLSFGIKHPPDHSPPLYILYNVFLI